MDGGAGGSGTGTRMGWVVVGKDWRSASGVGVLGLGRKWWEGGILPFHSSLQSIALCSISFQDFLCT